MGDLINIFVKAAFVENMVLIYFLGMCSYLAVSKTVKTAVGLGAAVIFVLAITAPINWVIRETLLVEGALTWLSPALENQSFEFLGLIIYIGVIAALVQLVEMLIEKFSPALYMSLGIFLPLITVNCAILGGTLFMIAKEYNLAESTVFGIGSEIGRASCRERV